MRHTHVGENHDVGASTTLISSNKPMYVPTERGRGINNDMSTTVTNLSHDHCLLINLH